VHPEVVVAMNELGLDLASAQPQRLTAELARDAAWLITMGCGDACPVVPGARREDWPLPDPKGKPVEEVRRIRDQIAAQVREFVEKHAWTRPGA
jgi:arsenate reductase